MSQALKLATLIPETESPRSKDRKVPPFVGSRMPFGRLQLADAPVLAPFHSDSGFGVRRRVQSPHTDPLKPSKPAGATTSKFSFGPFRLFPAQFLLLEGDKPVHLGSRALEMLIVLLERPGEFGGWRLGASVHHLPLAELAKVCAIWLVCSGPATTLSPE